MAASNHRSRRAGQAGLRHVWLAGLGLASVLRREAVNANERALAEARRLQRLAGGVIAEARSQVVAGVETAREQVEPIVAKVTNEMVLRVAPALEKMGLQALVPQKRRKKTMNKTARRAPASPSRRSKRTL